MTIILFFFPRSTSKKEIDISSVNFQKIKVKSQRIKLIYKILNEHIRIYYYYIL